MARRRSDLFEAPSAQTPGLNFTSDVADISGMYSALSSAATAVRDQIAMPIINQNSEEEGALAASRGDYDLESALLPGSEYYNRAVQTGYVARSAGVISGVSAQHEVTFASDPEGYLAAMDAARDEFINAAPAGMAAPAASEWARQTGLGLNSITNRVANNAITEARSSTETELLRLETELSRFENMSGTTYADLMEQYRTLGQNTADNPVFPMSQLEWEYRRDNFVGMQRARAIANIAEDAFDTRMQAPDANPDVVAREVLLQLEASLAEGYEGQPLLLTVEQYDATVRRARTGINRQVAVIRREQASANREIAALRREIIPEVRSEMGDVETAFESHQVITETRMTALGEAVGALRDPALMQRYEQLQSLLRVREGLRGQTSAEIAGRARAIDNALLVAENPESTEAQRAEAQALLQTYGGEGDAADARREMGDYARYLEDAPAAATAGLHGGVELGRLTDRSGAISPSLLTARIAAVNEYAQRMGITNRDVFTSEERAALTSVLEAGGPNAIEASRQIVLAAADASTDSADAQRLAASMFRQVVGNNTEARTARLIGTLYAFSEAEGPSNPQAIAAIIMSQQQRRANGDFVDASTANVSSDDRIRMANEVLSGSSWDSGTREYAISVADAIFAEGFANGSMTTPRQYRDALQRALGGAPGGSGPLGWGSFSWGGVDNRGLHIPDWIRRDRFNEVALYALGNRELRGSMMVGNRAWATSDAQLQRVLNGRPQFHAIIGSSGRYGVTYENAQGQRVTAPGLVIDIDNVREGLTGGGQFNADTVRGARSR